MCGAVAASTIGSPWTRSGWVISLEYTYSAHSVSISSQTHITHILASTYHPYPFLPILSHMVLPIAFTEEYSPLLDLSSFYLIYSNVQSQHLRPLRNPPRRTQTVLHRRLLHHSGCPLRSGLVHRCHHQLQSRYPLLHADKTNETYFASYSSLNGGISEQDYGGFKATLVFSFIITICLGIIWVVLVQFLPSKAPLITYLLGILLSVLLGVGGLFVHNT